MFETRCAIYDTRQTADDTISKRGIDVFGDVPPSVALMRAVKAEFDPNRVLSPGRFVGRL